MFNGNIELGVGYTSLTQQARRISEGWITKNAYCLNCDSDELSPTTANTKSRDFVSVKCSHGYELKSKRGLFGKNFLDGAYGTMLKTIQEGKNSYVPASGIF